MNEKILKKNVETLIGECEAGLNGKYFLYPEDITYSLTNRCNSYCIMCHYLSEDYENKTYFNAKPYNVTLKDFKEFMPKPSFWAKISSSEDKNFFKYIKRLSIIGAETFLNKETYDIVKYAKSTSPKLVLSILSNGSVPPPPGREDIVKYIDFVGFSVDGCTKETFEKIRTPLKFDRVITSIGRWVEARDKYNKNCSLSFAFAVSTMNFHELPGMVRLAHEMKLDFIYVQPLYVHPESRFDSIRNTSLLDMDKDLGHKYLSEAYKISKETGVRIDTWESIRRMFGIVGDSNEILNHGDEDLAEDFDPQLNKYCQRLSCLSMKYDEQGNLDGVCTSMKESLAIAEKYGIPKKGTPFEIYNSKGWWQLRLDLLNGKLIDI